MTARYIGFFLSLIWASCACTVSASVAGVPIGIGPIQLGSGKATLLEILDVDPLDCNSPKSPGFEDRIQVTTSNLTEGGHCPFPRKVAATIEAIELGGSTYHIIKANEDASDFIASIGTDATAIYFEDQLIFLEVMKPKVPFAFLASKYGEPTRLEDTTRLEQCEGLYGTKLERLVGGRTAEWNNQKVNAVFRFEMFAREKTCELPLHNGSYALSDLNRYGIFVTNMFRYIQVKRTTYSEAPENAFGESQKEIETPMYESLF